MNNNIIQFDLTNSDEALAAARLIQHFNEAGVPLKISNDGTTLNIGITDGY